MVSPTKKKKQQNLAPTSGANFSHVEGVQVTDNEQRACCPTALRTNEPASMALASMLLVERDELTTFNSDQSDDPRHPFRSSSTKKRGRESYRHTPPDSFDMQSLLDLEDFQFPSIEFPQSRVEEISSDSSGTTTDDSRPTVVAPQHRRAGDGETPVKRRRLGKSKRSTNIVGLLVQATPTLSESQQEFSEYALPIILPTLFVSLSMTNMALRWVAVLIAGHTMETFYTNFRTHNAPSSHQWKLSPLQHHFCDVLWLHGLITPMLVFPDAFGPRAFACGLALIPTLPIYLSVSFKTHHVHSSTCTTGSTTRHSPRQEQVQCLTRRLGGVLLECYALYGCALLILSASCSCWLVLTLGLVALNISPLVMFWSYTSDVGLQEYTTTTKPLVCWK